MIDPNDFLAHHPPVVQAGLKDTHHHKLDKQSDDDEQSASKSGFYQQQTPKELARARRRRARLRKKRVAPSSSVWTTFGSNPDNDSSSDADTTPDNDIDTGADTASSSDISRSTRMRSRRYSRRFHSYHDRNETDLDAQVDTDPDTEADDCSAVAVSSLNAADATQFMLEKRLASKGFDEQTIHRTMERLLRAGLINDEQFAHDLGERCLRRLMGPTGIRREFRRKGLDQQLAEQFIDEANRAGRFDESARTLVEDVVRHSRGSDRQQLLRRIASRASTRGLPLGLVRTYALKLLDEESANE